jgi:hypothetical protein
MKKEAIDRARLGPLGIWQDATEVQRAEVVRMKKQLGVYEMALRLAVKDAQPNGDHASTTRKLRTYIARAAVLVGADGPG